MLIQIDSSAALGVTNEIAAVVGDKLGLLGNDKFKYDRALIFLYV